jgi:hypothetical protein
MSLLIVPLLYPDLAELLNFSHAFQNNFRIANYSQNGRFPNDPQATLFSPPFVPLWLA